MCVRLTLSKKFAPSVRRSYTTELGRNNGPRKEILKEWRHDITVIKETKENGYPLNPGSVQKQIMNALHLGEREKASSLLSHIGYKNQMLKPNNFVKVLEYCAHTPDPPFVLEIWRSMEKKGVDLDNKSHVFVIQALCKGGYIEQAFDLMSNCWETSDLYPTLDKYNIILEAFAKQKDVSNATKFLELMERDMMGKNEKTYTSLLKLAVLQKDLTSVHNIWKEYAEYYNFNLISLRDFIWAFTRLNDVEAACGALQQLVNLVFKGRFTIKKTAEGKLVISRLDVPIPAYSNVQQDIVNSRKMVEYEFDLEEAKRVVRNRNIAVVMGILKLSFTDVVQACARMKNHELAQQLFFQMDNLGIRPARGAYDGLIRVLLQEKSLHDGMEVLKVMQEKNLKPLDSTLATLSARCSKDLDLDLAESFLNEMSHCTSAYPFNQLLHACDTLDEPERGVQVFAKMKKMNVAPNITTYELLLSLFGNVNAPYEEGNKDSKEASNKRIKAILQDMARNGIQHSYTSIKNLLKAVGSEGMLDEMLHTYLPFSENQLITPGPPIYNIVLNSFVQAAKAINVHHEPDKRELKESYFEEAVKIFKSLLQNGYRPDGVTCTIMIDCCSIHKSIKSAQCLLAYMIQNGYSLQLPTYTALLKVVSEFGDFDEALHILNKACSKRIQLDPLLFNTILRTASWMGRIDVLEYVMDRMHREGVPPDPETCSYVGLAYIACKDFTAADEALKVMSIHMLPKQEIDKNRKVFEEQVIYAEDEDSKAELRAFQLLKDENHVLALLNLRWCAMNLKDGDRISWVTSQSWWVKHLQATYRYR